MIDLRFSTALQIMLTLLHAEQKGVDCVNSTSLACSIGANPSFVRQMLVPLAQNGLVASAMGKNGGARLNRPSEEITLHDILKASASGKPVFKARTNYPTQCLVSWNFDSYFDRLSRDVDAAVLAVLDARTLAEAFAEIEEIDRKRDDPAESCTTDVASSIVR